MTVHLQKLSVGTESIESLTQWQLAMVARRVKAGGAPYHEHVTRMFPKQKEALLDGGSIYWVFKGLIQCRNKIIGLEEVRREDGIKACSIQMEPGPIPVVPTQKRPFQGWRYLQTDAAPADLTDATGGADLPADLRTKLVEIGAW